jgi:uncharacterized protein
VNGKHGSNEARRIAEAGTILRCLVGSGLHGLSIAAQDDEDQMGVCVEPPEFLIGLRRIWLPEQQESVKFGQYEHHTAWERPGGLANRSGPGDLDVVIYSLRKWMKLALAGNPTVLLLLFAPWDDVAVCTELGQELRGMGDVILSRQAGSRFAGYLDAQRRSLLSRDGKGRDVTRPELIAAYGFDSKFCAHMVRLGLQGVELMETGRITLPVPEPDRTWLRELRVGQHTMAEALERAEECDRRICDLQGRSGKSPLPEHPDYEAADAWLISAYQRAWAISGTL